MKEIERKYLARLGIVIDPDKEMYVIQNYVVVRPSFEIRIRRTQVSIPRQYIAHHIALKIGNGFIRREYEPRIPWWLFRLLDRIAPNVALVKTRYEVDGWSIDKFHGRFRNLILAEYEIPSADHPAPPVPPCLRLGPDVTEERTYANKNLATLDWPEARKLVMNTLTRTS